MMERDHEGPVCTLTEARGLAFENFLPFCLWAGGIPQPGQDGGNGPCPLKAGYVSSTNEALSQETKNKWASRSLNPQSLPIPYKINTKLLEIHTHVHTTQNPDLLSTTPHGFPNTDGPPLHQTTSITRKSQWALYTQTTQ